jgi:polyisoprenoid-binding protein YceI
VPHLGISTNRGRFDKKTGTVQLDKTGRSARVDITIETASISTGTAAFDQHLRGKDFFNSADFPTAPRSLKCAATSRCWARRCPCS